MAVWHIALGGNIGDVRETFSRALRLLSQREISVVQVSRTYRTTPVGDRAGNSFLNAAAAIETSLEPHSLLDRLQEVELALGRTRETRWGPRPIDLDLILCGDRVIEESRLTVPHPAAWYRRFVLDPLVELAANVVHPVKKQTIRELRDRLMPRPLQIAAAGGGSDWRRELLNRLREEFKSACFSDWEVASTEGPAILFWLGTGGFQRTEPSRFEELPLLPRLDTSPFGASIEPAVEFARGVLQAALDEPIICE